MSLPPLTEFDDPVARFLEWHHIRRFYADNDDAAMAKAYPQAKKHLKEWEEAFIALPKHSPAKGIFMTIVRALKEEGPEDPDDMAKMHHEMAILMPWTADQGLAAQWQRKLELTDDDFKDFLPRAIILHNAKNDPDLRRERRSLSEEERVATIKQAARELQESADRKRAASMGREFSDPEMLEQADEVIREGEAGLLHDKPDFVANFLKKRKEAATKDDTVIKSTTAPVEQQAPSAKAFTVEQALLNPKASKDRSKYKSAYFLWGQIKSHHNVGERFKLTETQASTWAGVAKGQHTKDVVKVLVDVRAIERIKRTLDYRRLV